MQYAIRRVARSSYTYAGTFSIWYNLCISRSQVGHVEERYFCSISSRGKLATLCIMPVKEIEMIKESTLRKREDCNGFLLKLLLYLISQHLSQAYMLS